MNDLKSSLGAMFLCGFVAQPTLPAGFHSLLSQNQLGGIILFAPVLVYLFPAIPAWVGNIFPTYYIVQPIVDISQSAAGWSDVAFNVFILLGLDVVLTGILVAVLRKTRQFAT